MYVVLDKVAENGSKTLNCCLLCRSTDGIFSDIYLKKFAEVPALLKEILKVQLNQNEAKSKMICHKCIFKLKVQKEFKDMQIGEKTIARMCIICGDVGHSDLKITYPDVKNKLKLWSEENRVVSKKPDSVLCTVCFHKLELLDDLKIQASMNLAQNEIYESISEDNVPNMISKNNKKLMSVKDMVQLGLVKVERAVLKDTNMYVNLLKVNLVNISGNNKKVLTKRRSVMKKPTQNIEKKMNQWKVKLNSVPKKEQRKKPVRTSETRQNEVSEDIEEIVVKPPRSKKRSAIKSTKVPKGDAAFNPDENLNCITVHKDEINNPTNIMIPVIILNRVEVTETIKSTRKRALQDVNEAKEEEAGHEVKEKLAKIVVVNGLGGEETKSNEMKENILKIPNGTEAAEQNSEEKVNGNTYSLIEESTKEDQAISATNEVDNLESLSTPTSPSPVSSSPEEVKNTDNLPANKKEDDKMEEVLVIEETVEAKTVNNIEDDEEVILPKFVADDSESSDTEKISQDVNDQKESEESSKSEAVQAHEPANEILKNDKDGASDTISDKEMKSDEEQGIRSDVKEQKESHEESSDSEGTQQVQEPVNEIIVNDKDGTALEAVHDEEMKSDKEGIKCDEEGIIKADETINLIQDDAESEDELTLIAKHINSFQTPDKECNEKIMNNELIEAATELMEVDQKVVESTKDNDIPV